MKIHKALYISIFQVVFVLFSQNLFAAAASNVKCDGCVDTSDIAKKAVTASKIKPAAVTTSKIKDGAVTAAKLAGGISNGLTTTIRTEYSNYNTTNSFYSEVIFVSCLSGEVLTGGSCDCFTNDWNADTTNYGWVDGCGPAGNSMVATCSTGIADVDLQLWGPPVSVYAICAPATLQSGAEVNAQVLAIQSESNLPSDGSSGTPDLAAQIMIDKLKMKAAYREEQMLLKAAQ